MNGTGIFMRPWPGLKTVFWRGVFRRPWKRAAIFVSGNARCSVRVFERYSFLGSNRVSLSVTLFQGADGITHLSAVTSGGSQAMFFKINTWGEDAFLDKLRDVLKG